MKKKILPALFMAGMLLLQGCGGSSATESTIEISSKGVVTQTTIETLDAEYYDSDELKSYVQDQVDEYNEESTAAGTVKLKKFKYSASEGTVTLVLKFSDADTYADFEWLTFFVGTVDEAKAAGYEFSVTLIPYEDAPDADETLQESGDAVQGAASSDAQVFDGTQGMGLSGEENVVILQESYQVAVPGDVLYVTDGACSVVSDDTVAVDASQNDLIYIIYE